MPSGSYSQLRTYSPVHDCVMVRLSVWNGRGGEFWRLLPWDKGRRWRERREQALELIDEAIGAGLDPGEVVPAPMFCDHE